MPGVRWRAWGAVAPGRMTKRPWRLMRLPRPAKTLTPLFNWPRIWTSWARGMLPKASSLRPAPGLAAGAWQLSKWKSHCLGHCRSPVFFLMHAWRDGPAGALLTGAHHGAYCVACCWGLMLVLTVLGVMSVAWMAVIAAVVFAEKVLPHGPRIGRVAGVALAAAWIVLFVRGMH